MTTESLTYIHADPHDAFFILVAVVDGDDVGMVADDAVKLTETNNRKNRESDRQFQVRIKEFFSLTPLVDDVPH
jgi:hypothetical protein